MIHVHCAVHKLRSAFGKQTINFELDTQVLLKPMAELGPKGLSAVGADLINLAAAVYQIEKLLSGNTLTNPPERFELTLTLHAPKLWTVKAIETASKILHLLGNATWKLNFKGTKDPPFLSEFSTANGEDINQVMLFSGGLDSTCGATTLVHEAQFTKLVSFYTRQKSLQQALAVDLKHNPPLQWRNNYPVQSGRGRSFYYRSFLFLVLAAVSAESWGARKIFHFENGILATAISPTSAFFMTKHAHPAMHRLAEILFSELFRGTWQVCNPFLDKTKHESLLNAGRLIGEESARLFAKTETCWYQAANRYPGGRKSPAKACGACVPCIIRHTALPLEKNAVDLSDDKARNDARIGVAFRSYYGFLHDVLQTSDSPTAFYRLLPAGGRALIASNPSNHSFTLPDLHSLFLRFALEFMEAYNLE